MKWFIYWSAVDVDCLSGTDGNDDPQIATHHDRIFRKKNKTIYSLLVSALGCG